MAEQAAQDAAAHKAELADLRKALDCASTELAQVRQQSSMERDQLVAEAEARMGEMHEMEHEHSEAVAMASAAAAEALHDHAELEALFKVLPKFLDQRKGKACRAPRRG